MQRVFIGVPINQGQQRQINELLDSVSNPGREIRWVMEQNRHLTLAFLGDQSAAVVDALVRSMDAAYQWQSAFQTVFTGLVRFPNAKGHILALVGSADDRLARLFQLTCGLLTQHRLAPEYRTFRPHITVGKIARPRLLKACFNQPANINLDIDKVTLYQSTLTRTGSVYLALKETRLA